MGPLLVSLLPFILGSALVPLQIILFILLLKSPRQGPLKAAAFLAGMTTTRLLQGAVFSLVFTAESVEGQPGGKSPVVATLLLVLGLLLLISAFRKWRKEVDPDEPPPQWLARVDALTPLKAFAIGLGLLLIGPKFWVFTLSALATIGEAQVGQPASAIAYVLFILLAQSLLVILIAIRLAAPAQSKGLLNRISTWLERNNRAIVITVSLVFGLYFLYQGLSGLLG